MNCFEAQEKIIDLVLDELTRDEVILLEEHLNDCPLCHDDFELLNECLQVCVAENSETCVCQFQETYWDEFIVTVHDKISQERIERKFPFQIVLPIAATALAAFLIGYYFFLRPQPKERVQETRPDYEEYDPYEDIYELSPEETEEFIEMINQRYGGE